MDLSGFITTPTEIDTIKMLVYGAPGTGKTYLARTCVEAGFNTLVIDADRGSFTLRGSDVKVLPVHQNYAQVEAAVRWLHEAEHGFDVVVFDNLTSAQKLDVEATKRDHGRKFGLHSWGHIVARTANLATSLRDLRCHVIVLAHSMELHVGDDEVRIRPSLNGKKLPHEIGGLFDVVGYAHIGGGVRDPKHMLGFVAGGERHICKDRSGRLGIVEPNDFGLIHQKMFGLHEVLAPEALPSTLSEREVA